MSWLRCLPEKQQESSRQEMTQQINQTEVGGLFKLFSFQISSHGWTVVAHRVEMLLSLLTRLTRKSSRPQRRDLQVHDF